MKRGTPMSKKILTIQDISCYGNCSITVALPILARYGIETAILPSAILSTHTAGFKDFTFLDLTDEMPKIIDHWKKEGIEFDAIYTGYIGNPKQFGIILDAKAKLLKEGGLFIVDPAMADHGKLYPGFDEETIIGMRELVSVADYIIPNITEACFLTRNDFEEIQESKNNFINLNSLDWSNRVFFIKKFLISKNCVLFRLSNKLIQIFFNDDTEMSFSTETTKFLYINQDGKEINRDIQDAMNGNDRDLTNKIKISKNMLIYFVKTHKSKKVPK
jgi:hydroxymethylpyrimidine/phosphomethylpyrimidine kinase